MKIIRVVVRTVFAGGILFLSSCAGPAATATHERVQEAELTDELRTLRPWTTKEAFHAADWKRYVAVARLLQRASPDVAEASLDKFTEMSHDIDRENPNLDSMSISRALILLRVAYVYPRSLAVKGDVVVLARGWLGQEEPHDASDKDPSWPVAESSYGFTLLDDYGGYTGFEYQPKFEYAYAAAHFNRRDFGPFTREDK